MKKILSVFIVIVMVLSFAACGKKEESGIKVYVSLTKGGENLMAAQEIVISDEDKDGFCTIDDALREAHKAIGQSSDYESAEGDYGLCAVKLLGDESGSFGYYINNASPQNLADKITSGDHVYAYVYSDLTYFSDSYTYFDKFNTEAKTGESVDLELSVAGFDANWNMVTLPGSDMTILIDGVESTYKTDADGKVSINFDKAGTYDISAKSDTLIIIPPVCIVNVK